MDRQTLLNIKAKAFDKQMSFINDKSLRKVMFVPRRGAKTTAIAILFLLFAFIHKNIRLIFIGLTSENAENAFLPALLPILQEFGIIEGKDYKYNQQDHIFTFLQTNSTISLKGYDVSYKEMDKILGGKCFAVAIDECQSQTQDLEKAILYKIQPALSDYIPQGGGILILAGTAGDMTGSNFWYRICEGYKTEKDADNNPATPHLGWSFHTWEGQGNPHMKVAKILEDAEFEKRYGPKFRELDWYQQQYLNKWIVSESRHVYHFNNFNIVGYTPTLPDGTPDLQKTTSIPPDFFKNAIYGLGMDWGYAPDPMAFVVGAYNFFYSNKMVVVKTFKKTEMLPHHINDKIDELDKIYHFQFMVADAGGQGKAHVANINITYHKHIMVADKFGKAEHQEMLNSDLQMGFILIPPDCIELIDELQNLLLDPIKLNQGKRVEKSSQSNNLADALLYLHHHCRHQWYREPTLPILPPNPNTQEGFHQRFMSQFDANSRTNRPDGWLDDYSERFQIDVVPEDDWKGR